VPHATAGGAKTEWRGGPRVTGSLETERQQHVYRRASIGERCTQSHERPQGIARAPSVDAGGLTP
jgi:hypothetical protein